MPTCEPAARAGADLTADLRRALESRRFATMSEVQAFADEFMQARNRQPMEDFGGLSPHQISQVLYEPFESPDLVTLTKDIAFAHCRC